MDFLKSNRKLILASILVIIAVLGRLLPHAWNATPLVAVALFAGAYLGGRYALVVPIVAMIASDFFIGFYDPAMMLAVYGSFALAGIIGLVVAQHKSVLAIVLGALSASTLFFFITNAAVWAFAPYYSPGVAGLAESLMAGVPFYKNMLMGDVMYTALLFGAYESVIQLSHVKKYSDQWV